MNTWLFRVRTVGACPTQLAAHTACRAVGGVVGIRRSARLANYDRSQNGKAATLIRIIIASIFPTLTMVACTMHLFQAGAMDVSMTNYLVAFTQRGQALTVPSRGTTNAVRLYNYFSRQICPAVFDVRASNHIVLL